MRSITILNKSTLVKSIDFIKGVNAVNAQVQRDFGPAWGVTANIFAGIDTRNERIYLLDDPTVADALGYHTTTAAEVPVGYVFIKPTLAAGDRWEATLSHEVLEQIVDPSCSLCSLVNYEKKPTMFAYEVCDAVENDEYQINGIPVSNFVLPSWFFQPPFIGKVDFLGKRGDPLSLSPGGYISFTRDLKHWQAIYGSRVLAHHMNPNSYSRVVRRNK